MALITTDAIVLKSMRWGEADRIVIFFSRKLGKVRGIARGARRMNSRFGGALEPFTYVNLTVFDRRNDSLASISHVEILENFTALREDLQRMSAAARMVSVVEGMTADRDPSHELVCALQGGLRALCESRDLILTTLIFQIHVLTLTGFRPQIDHCASCGQNIEVRSLKFSALAGGLLCQACEQASWDSCIAISPGSVAFIQQARRMRFPVARRLNAVGQVRDELEKMIETYVRMVVNKRLPAMDCLATDPSPANGMMDGRAVAEQASAV